jgi:hypothetical protein
MLIFNNSRNCSLPSFDTSRILPGAVREKGFLPKLFPLGPEDGGMTQRGGKKPFSFIVSGNAGQLNDTTRNRRRLLSADTMLTGATGMFGTQRYQSAKMEMTRQGYGLAVMSHKW